jgi:hypothetical protein
VKQNIRINNEVEQKDINKERHVEAKDMKWFGLWSVSILHENRQAAEMIDCYVHAFKTYFSL